MVNIITVGIDAGAENLKVVVLKNQEHSVIVMPYGKSSVEQVALNAVNTALNQAGISIDMVDRMAATGFSRDDISFVNVKYPDSICLAKGIHRLIPEATMVVDIGKYKIMAVKCRDGLATCTAGNDKCAGGAGMLIDAVAEIMGLSVTECGNLACLSNNPEEVLNTCAVFTETDVISLIHMGKKPVDIIYGVFLGLASRVSQVLSKLGKEANVAIVGGVANNSGMIRAIKEVLECNILVPPSPETIGAYGAAITAQER